MDEREARKRIQGEDISKPFAMGPEQKNFKKKAKKVRQIDRFEPERRRPCHPQSIPSISRPQGGNVLEERTRTSPSTPNLKSREREKKRARGKKSHALLEEKRKDQNHTFKDLTSWKKGLGADV